MRGNAFRVTVMIAVSNRGGARIYQSQNQPERAGRKRVLER
jgi:hypothetical protein